MKPSGRQEESSFFEKKEAKKLCSFGPRGHWPSRAGSLGSRLQVPKVFLLLFFQKKKTLAFLLLACLILPAQAADPERGRQIATSRAATCVLCHPGPFPGQQATIAPDLRGVGARLTAEQLRTRLTDPAALNPQTIMPSFNRTDGLQRVGAPWRGKPILTDAQIEDVVAWLTTLRTP
jgi:sulfur-oxidizing protein SoxX